MPAQSFRFSGDKLGIYLEKPIDAMLRQPNMNNECMDDAHGINILSINRAFKSTKERWNNIIYTTVDFNSNVLPWKDLWTEISIMNLEKKYHLGFSSNE